MYVIDGIAYAGEKEKPIKVISVRAMGNYMLWLRFSTGEQKTFDFAPLLDSVGFLPLKDKALFNSVYVDYGVPVWNDGDIDIAPEYLYENGKPCPGRYGNAGYSQQRRMEIENNPFLIEKCQASPPQLGKRRHCSTPRRRWVSLCSNYPTIELLLR